MATEIKTPDGITPAAEPAEKPPILEHGDRLDRAEFERRYDAMPNLKKAELIEGIVYMPSHVHHEHHAEPHLEQGDHLDRAEFERRYDAMPNLKKAELIEGVVYMSSPVSVGRHGRPHARLVALLVTYESSTPGVGAVDNGSVRLTDQNMPQPDAALFIEPSKGGQARISVDDYLEGAPELVAEVSSSSASVDLHAKLELYRRTGVREYLVWRVGDKAIDWFMLKDGAYERLPADESGVYRSVVFPGLWLDSRALFAGDLARVLAVLGQGLASAEHAAFKASLG